MIHMYRFFIDSTQLNNDIIEITGDDYNHIRNVLRMKVGEKVLISDGSDKEYEACIVEYCEDGKNNNSEIQLVSNRNNSGNSKNDSNNVDISKRNNYEGSAVRLKITDVFGNSRELPAKITLFQGYPKGDKMEQIVQKAVELGAYEIVPVMMNRCVVKLDEKRASKKVERLNAIAESASKQSKRGIIPKVREVMTMEQAIDYAKILECVIIPYECAEGMECSRKIIKESTDSKSIGIFIGPEGGFEAKEIEALKGIGGNVISLGHRILRTETAGMTVMSILMWMLEE